MLPSSGDLSYLHLHKQPEAVATALYEGVTVLRPILSASVRAHALLSYAPTNRLLAWLRRRDRLKFGIPFMLLGLAYWMATILLAAWIQSGAPAALNLLVLLTFWNGAKFIAFGGSSPRTWCIGDRVIPR